MTRTREARDARTADPVARARGLAVPFGLACVLASGLAWGPAAAAAAALGAFVSLVNLWALARLAARAVERAVCDGPQVAASALVAGLTVKTVAIGAVVWIGARAAIPLVPLGLGLLVAVFALLAAGFSAARGEA